MAIIQGPSTCLALKKNINAYPSICPSTQYLGSVFGMPDTMLAQG